MNGRIRATLTAGLLLAGLLTAGQPTVASLCSARAADMHAAGAGPVRPARQVIPLLAYYYIWFNRQSWNRAKIDYPAVGLYSSDDPTVMRRQVETAKSAGIEGFIVSWKDTPTDDRRLRMLVSIAIQEHFKLAMIYEGLDFYRHPLPVSEVSKAFQMFRNTYARSPAFLRLGRKPLTIWSGTWEYSHAEVARVTRAVRSSLLVLNTEKNVAGFLRLADVTDGDAYYWSSVNPATNTNYGPKLGQMSKVIHQRGELWIAPFAPGFDARLLGGRTVVRRDGGQTLRAEYATAIRSAPDVLGLISWNEFSENTYVEPSRRYGSRYLDVLSRLRLTSVPRPPSTARSAKSMRVVARSPAPGMRVVPASYWPSLLRLAGFAAALVLGTGIVGYVRQRRVRPRGKHAALP